MLIEKYLWKIFCREPITDRSVILEHGETHGIIPEKQIKLAYGFVLSPTDALGSFKMYKSNTYLQYVVCFRNIKTYDFYRNHELATIWANKDKIKVYVDARDVVVSPTVDRVKVQRAFEWAGFKEIKFEN